MHLGSHGIHIENYSAECSLFSAFQKHHYIQGETSFLIAMQKKAEVLGCNPIHTHLGASPID